MWEDALQAVKGFFGMHSVSSTEQDEYSDTVSRLRHLPHRNLQAEVKNDVVEPVDILHHKKVSLFESVSNLRSSERKSVGHWCESSAAAAREENSHKVEHSYETDFGSGATLEESSLYPFIAKSARNKALHGYIMNSELQRPVAGTGSAEFVSEPMPSIIKMQSLSDTEELLLRFAQDDTDEFVRASVAANENSPSAAMWLLAADKSLTVKLALIENPKVPLAVLEVLGKDFDAKVARRAQNKIKQLCKGETGIVFGNLSRDYDVAGESEEEQPFSYEQAM